MFSPSKTKVTVISLLLVATGATLLSVSSILRTGRRLECGANQCTSVIAFLDRQTDAVCVYSAEHGTSVADGCVDGWHVVSLLSGMRRPQGWLCKACSPNSETGQFVMLGDGKIHPIPVRGGGEAGVYDGRIGIADAADGRAVLTCYDLKGKRSSARILKVPGHHVTAVHSPVTWSTDGLAAVALSVDLERESRVYVFSESGTLLADLGPGHLPAIDHKGGRVAYLLPSSSSFHQVQVGLYDTKARTRTQIAAWYPTRPAELLPYCGATDVHEVKWSDDGKWLICALGEATRPDSLICAVQLDSRRWCRLPIRVVHGRWAVGNGDMKKGTERNGQ